MLADITSACYHIKKVPKHSIDNVHRGKIKKLTSKLSHSKFQFKTLTFKTLTLSLPLKSLNLYFEYKLITKRLIIKKSECK